MKIFLRLALLGVIGLSSAFASLSAMCCFSGCSELSKDAAEIYLRDFYDLDKYAIELSYLSALKIKEKHYLTVDKHYKNKIILVNAQIIENSDVRIILEKINSILIPSISHPKQLATLEALAHVCAGRLKKIPKKYQEALFQQELIDSHGYVTNPFVREVVKVAVTVLPGIMGKRKPTICMHTEDEFYKYFEKGEHAEMIIEATSILGPSKLI